MPKLRRWIPSILCLLVLWLGVFVAVRTVSSRKPSVATVLEFLNAWPGASGPHEARRAWMAKFAGDFGDLDLDSRAQVLMAPPLRSVFVGMAPEDQTHFLEAIEPPGMKTFIEGSKRGSVGRCWRLLRPALVELETLAPGSTAPIRALVIPDEGNIGPAMVVGIEGVFKEPTTPLTRFTARPVVERIQAFSQKGR